MNKTPPGPFDEEIVNCEYGHYPWDYWHKKAIKSGIPEDLAGIGRLVMREAYQHDWPTELKSLCGWSDNGKRMIALAKRSPETAKQRWNRLLETDGLRGEYDPQTLEWRPNANHSQSARLTDQTKQEPR